MNGHNHNQTKEIEIIDVSTTDMEVKQIDEDGRNFLP